MASTKQALCYHYRLATITSLSFVGYMTAEEESQGKEAMLHLDHDTITAIINEITTTLQKGPTQKGMSPALW